MRGLMGIAALLLALSACGGDGDKADVEPTEPTTSASTPAATTLVEACPQVEEVNLKGQSPGIDDLTALLARVSTLANSGDTETQLALKPVREAAIELSNVALDGGNQVPAWRKFDNAIIRLADRCAAVGSSAFQG